MRSTKDISALTKRLGRSAERPLLGRTYDACEQLKTAASATDQRSRPFPHEFVRRRTAGQPQERPLGLAQDLQIGASPNWRLPRPGALRPAIFSIVLP
jgi:hypothetical protein